MQPEQHYVETGRVSVTLSCDAYGSVALSVVVERRPETWSEGCRRFEARMKHLHEMESLAFHEDHERMLRGELPLDPFRRGQELKGRRMEAEADAHRDARRKEKARAKASVIGRIFGAVKSWVSPKPRCMAINLTGKNAGRRCMNPPKDGCVCGTHLNFAYRNGRHALRMV